jgi:benzylsuccinate CoA-transferase BbsF subunit
VHSNQTLLADPQLEHRGHFVYYDKPRIGRHVVQRSEFRLARAEAARNRPTPFIGEHTRQVCREFLGMNDAEVEALIAAGVLEVAGAEAT